MSGTDYTTTPNLALFKPISNRAVGTWGDLWNANADALDAAIAGSGANVINVLDHGAKGDGSTDDTAAIQSVLNAHAGKATVFIPDTGNAYLCSQLSIPSGTDLLIQGLIRSKPGSTSHLIYVNSVANIHIRGHGTLDGNNTANPYPGSNGGTLFILSSTDVQVSGLTIAHAPLWNLVAQQSHQIRFDNLTLVGGRNASGFSAGCDDCWMTNCLIDGPDADIGFSFYGGITNSGAIGNHVRNSGGTAYSAVGISVLSDTAQTAACSNIVISSNVIHNVGGSGIEVLNAGNPNDHDNITISGNVCHNNGKRPIGSRGDIHINGANNVVVTGNTSENFGSNTDSWFGLYVSSTSSGVSFIGNFISGTGQGGTAGFGLYVDGAGALLASGNYFVDNTPTPTMAFSIGGTAGQQCGFIGNFCCRPINLTLAPDTVMANGVSGQWIANYTATGGTASRAAQDRAVEALSVKDFGAKGDGSDDGPAFAAALAHVAGGGKLIVPAGGYNINQPLSQAITGTVSFIGAGSGNTILYFNAAADGLTFSLPSNENVHVVGFTFVRAFSGPTYANNGLVITTPGGGTALHYGHTLVQDITFIGGSGFWANQIYVYNCQCVSFDHILGVMPNATGTSTGGCGISIAGQSGSSYLTEAKFDDINFEGGSVGLQIGDWIQGVYVSNCSFAGNDYGIRWSGVSGDADLWLAVVNTHCNSGTRGILAYQAEGAQITNTYHLHFGIPSLDGIYAAVELFNMDGGLVSNNNFYCNGSSSTSASEYGVRIIGGNSSVVHGNRINNPKTAGILLDSSVQNTIVSGTLGTGFTAGVPLIQDTTGYSSNQKYGNQLNGVPDLFTDGSNTLAATALNIYGPLQATSLRTTGSPSSYTVQGGYLMWNKTGNGMTDFVNNRGLGGGGFLFIDTDGTTDVTLLTMTRTNAAFTVPLAIGANQVVGPRIAGWGTSTGGVRGAVTGSSTLPQVAAALAQLLTDLKTHGMIGA